jgi:hypothetical protein
LIKQLWDMTPLDQTIRKLQTFCKLSGEKNVSFGSVAKWTSHPPPEQKTRV